MEPIDANEYLIQFLGSIDNLPSEIHYHLSELTTKDQEIEQLTERIERRKRRLWNLYDDLPIDEDSDCSVVESIYEDVEEDEESNSDDDDCYEEDQDDEQFIIKKKRRRVTRVVTEFEDEEMLKDKIIKDYVRASQLQDEKIELANGALSLVERHIKRLDEDFDSLFPQQNLRDSSTSTPASPSRVESFSGAQPIAQSSIPASTHMNRNVASPFTSVTATSSNFPSTAYDYSKGLYSSADSDEGQISLPMLPNPSSTLNRSNKALASGANNGRRRKQNNMQSSTTSYTSNNEIAVNNGNLPRGIKLRAPNEDHLSVSSSIGDSNGINGANLLDQDDSTATVYDNSIVTESSTFLSHYIPDPNEPLYCICRQVSYGEMIGCDGENCPVEWYHIDCVGLSAVPEGRWYCDHCTGMPSQKKRKRGRPAAGSVS